jgi:transposase
MHERTNIQLSRADRSKLEAVVANRNSPQKHAWRAKIVLLTADGRGTAEIMQATGKAKTVIWRWQERFRDEGAAGLWRDKTRRSRIPPLSPEVAKRVVALTLAGPPPAASHWTGSAMAKAAGIGVSSVQRIWRAHGLQPHRVRQFKLSNDPQFAAKLHEIVGLYVNPPSHAIVLSVDEKSQIQALDRTQPGLPMKKGRAGTITHDYKRHGVTTLFAALNVRTDNQRQQAEPIYLESTLLRVFGVLFCHDPKRARSRTGKIEINRGVAEKGIAVRFDPEYAQPGPFAHKVAMAVIRKQSGFGRPAQKAISFSQRMRCRRNVAVVVPRPKRLLRTRSRICAVSISADYVHAGKAYFNDRRPLI